MSLIIGILVLVGLIVLLSEFALFFIVALALGILIHTGGWAMILGIAIIAAICVGQASR